VPRQVWAIASGILTDGSPVRHNKGMKHARRVQFCDDLYARVFELLGKREDSNEYQKFVHIMGKPCHNSAAGPYRVFSFHKLGLLIDYDTRLEGFSSITFQFDTASVRLGTVTPYRGGLPFDIKRTDDVYEVERKVGVKPESAGWVKGCQSPSCDAKSRASDYWQHYDVPPYRLTAIFDSPHDGLGMLVISGFLKRKNAD